MSRRNQAGRFSGGSNRESFDLVRSLRALFRAAEKGGDYAGAASIARVLRDLDPGPAPAADNDLDIDALTLPEKKELHDIVVAVKLLKNKVRARQGRELLPIPEPFKEPEPPRVLPPQWYPPQPAPKPKVEADENAAPASTPVAVDPLDDYIAGESDEPFDGPVEVLE